MIGRHRPTWDKCAQIQKMLKESPGGWEILTDRQKQIVDCIRRNDTSSFAEIGRQLGISRERIRQHIYQVQWKLKKYRAANAVQNKKETRNEPSS